MGVKCANWWVGVVRLRACLKTGDPMRPRTLGDAPSRQRLRQRVWFSRGRLQKNQSSGDTLDGVSRGVFASRPCLRVRRGSGGMNSSSCSSAPQRSTDGGGGPRVLHPLSPTRGLPQVPA